MKVLHILKTEPEKTVDELVQAFTEVEVKTVPLFEGGVDWTGLVEDIFSYDRVICWW